MLRKLERANLPLIDDNKEPALPGLLDPVVQFLLSPTMGHLRRTSSLMNEIFANLTVLDHDGSVSIRPSHNTGNRFPLATVKTDHARTSLSCAPSFASCSLLKRSCALCHASTNWRREAPSIEGSARRMSRMNCETHGLGRSNGDPGGPPMPWRATWSPREMPRISRRWRVGRPRIASASLIWES